MKRYSVCIFPADPPLQFTTNWWLRAWWYAKTHTPLFEVRILDHWKTKHYLY